MSKLTVEIKIGGKYLDIEARNGEDFGDYSNAKRFEMNIWGNEERLPLKTDDINEVVRLRDQLDRIIGFLGEE